MRYVSEYGKLPGMEAGDHTAPNPDQTQTERGEARRYTVAEAAELLGITAEAVRTRIKRGKLESVKEGGTVYVLLRANQTGPNADPTVKGQDRTADKTGVVEELRDRIAYLERQVEEEREARRRADTILAQLSQANAEQARTIRAIEAPAASGEGREDAPGPAEPRPDTPTPPETSTDAQEATERPQRTFWQRIFGE